MLAKKNVEALKTLAESGFFEMTSAFVLNDAKPTLQMKALGSMSILLVQLSKESQFRDILHDQICILLDANIVETVTEFLQPDELDLAFTSLALLEIFSLIKFSCEGLMSTNLITALVSLQSRLADLLTGNSVHDSVATKIHRVSTKLLSVLYNIFLATSNRVEYLTDQKMIQVIYSVLISQANILWTAAIRRRAVCILVLFSFFPGFGDFLSSQSISIPGLIVSLISLAKDETSEASHGPCLDLIAFVLYQNLTHRIEKRVISIVFGGGHDGGNSVTMMATVVSCLHSGTTSAVSALRLLHTLCCYQDKESVMIWKRLVDSWNIPNKLLQLLPQADTCDDDADTSLYEALILAYGTLMGAPPLFTWEIHLFSQLSASNSALTASEESIYRR